MNYPKINIIFIAEITRSKLTLEPNEILNEVLVKKEEIGIYNRARLIITSLLVFVLLSSTEDSRYSVDTNYTTLQLSHR